MTVLAQHIYCLARRLSLWGLVLLILPLSVLGQDVAKVVATDGTAAANLPAGPNFDVTGMVSSLVFVILCIVGLMWMLRRSRLVAGTGQAGVKLVSQIPLSMKEKLLVVQVGDEKLLLGCTTTAINTLHSWASAPDDENTKPPESAFAKLLAKHQIVTPKKAEDRRSSANKGDQS
ncbi:Flagellar protein FliO [Zhongshania aliphaticivorans]|uniref:Flagellar protein n=1 Tax=Zhongshania aliphaticivorans TaxID=1470434 RepID=A0A5S9P489_9GAMM|nr:flagellar biosynthetic protein FliO [Zhongshania aliphaticivorans]CAA0090694.1 Flagellar protein FliO [Zhongshania aliphaticivorans]CAA0098192.1 Flagellar protein FliO [Zhongshania aliphaticivorans]